MNNAEYFQKMLTNPDETVGAPIPASEVSYTPSGGLASGTVQDALDELDTEKASGAHSHTSSDITDLTETVLDLVAAALVAGSNISISYNDPSGLITIAATGGGSGLTEAQVRARSFMRC